MDFRKSAGFDDLSRWIDAFILDRKSQDLAQGTLYFYRAKLKLFTNYASENSITRISQLTPDFIRAYLIDLSHSHNPGGVHAAYRALKSFLTFFEDELGDENYLNPIRNVKAPKVSVHPLEPVPLEIVSKLLKVCDASSFCGARDHAIILFLLDTGLRASELCSLDVDDLDVVGGSVLVRSGKGGKPRIALIGKRTRKAVRSYLLLRPEVLTDALWLTDDGDRLSYWSLNLMLKRRAKQAGVPKPELHDFRRAFALSCLRSGMDVYSLQRLMGHSDLSVLRRYLAQTDDDLKTAHAKASPVNNL